MSGNSLIKIQTTMITAIKHKNILKTTQKHIAFAINAEGINDSGFVSSIAEKHCPSLRYTGIRKLGDVVTFKTKTRAFHGLVCHRLSRHGWKHSPKYIEQGLNKIHILPNEQIAIVVLGGGDVGKKMGANVERNVQAIHRAKKNCVLYSLDYDRQEIMKMLERKI